MKRPAHSRASTGAPIYNAVIKTKWGGWRQVGIAFLDEAKGSITLRLDAAPLDGVVMLFPKTDKVKGDDRDPRDYPNDPEMGF